MGMGQAPGPRKSDLPVPTPSSPTTLPDNRHYQRSAQPTLLSFSRNCRLEYHLYVHVPTSVIWAVEMRHPTPPNSSPLCVKRSVTWAPVVHVDAPEESDNLDAWPTLELPLTPRRPRALGSPIRCNQTPADSSPLGAALEVCPGSPTVLTRSATAAAAAAAAAAATTAESSSSKKEKKPPSITPRKFRKFFTPRPVPVVTRSALHDITRSSLNATQPVDETARELFRNPARSNARAGKRPTAALDGDDLDNGNGKRQKTRSIAGLATLDNISSSPANLLESLKPPSPKLRIPLNHRGTVAQVFQRELGDIDRAFDMLELAHPVLDWRTETADFCSGQDYIHSTAQADSNQPRSTIFSQAACNTNDMVLIGDNMGNVRLLKTDVSGEDGFQKPHVLWTAHDNAVTDVAVSADDLRAATASADRTGIVWDTMTQKPLTLLPCNGSVKSIRFQPGQGAGNVVATSSRDGLVQVWDLRCRNGRFSDWQDDTMGDASEGCEYPVPHSAPLNSFVSAHQASARGGRGGQHAVVTTLEFMPAGKEHLILSACEANATIKLWDIRAVRHEQGNNASKPVSVVAPPPGHAGYRDWGVSSLALGSDGARVYALCKDNTVYAYSTAHLALGRAPELDAGYELTRRRSSPVHSGLAPLYGFRHTLFTSPSFFVKLAVRPARDGHSEMIAVGSGHGTPVLFPTDEGYIRSQQDVASAAASGVSLPARTEGSWGFPASNRHVTPRPAEATPIFTSGTPLIHGHAKEATSVSFTSGGRLVTASDDFTARVWSENRDQARQLRHGGWTGGQRWGWGWASIDQDFDEHDGDEF
ncbi:hypothetical protein RB597_003765 [Gaeumannomyces tritici]